MKITIAPANAEQETLDTEVELQCERLLSYIREREEPRPADLMELKKIYDVCLTEVQKRGNWEELTEGEWTVVRAAAETLDACVKKLVGDLLEYDPITIEAARELHLALAAVFPVMEKYDRARLEAIVSDEDETENVVYREYFRTAYELDYDSEDSDLDDEEDEGAYHTRTRVAQRMRRTAPKRTFRRHGPYDPTFETVKRNMQIVVHGKTEIDFSIAFRSSKPDEVATKLETAKNTKLAQGARNTAYAELVKSLWVPPQWNRFVDENAQIVYPRETWTKELEGLLAEVNTAIREGKKLPDNPFVVAQYRGIAYNVVSFSVAARRRSREAVELHLPIYSTAVFNAAGIPPGDYYAGMYTDDSENSKRVRENLAVTAEYLQRVLVGKRKPKEVVFDGGTYSSPAMALQNLYTVGYDPFFAVLGKTLDLKRKGAAATKEKVTEARELRQKLETELAALKEELAKLREEKGAYDKQQQQLAKAKEQPKKGRARAEASADLPAERERLLTFDQEGYLGLAARVAKLQGEADAAALESKGLEALAAEMFEGLLDGSNPLVSTGSTPRHSLRYAYAMKFYSGASKKNRLVPEWEEDTRARHPYVGKVYVSLHPPQDYVGRGAPLDVIALTVRDEIDVESNILAEREASFPAYIPRGRVVAEHIARFPSFVGEYQEAFAEKYGLTEEDYNNYYEIFALAKSGTAKESLFSAIGEWLVRYHEARLVELARALAASQKQVLVYRDAKGLLTRVLPPVPTIATGVRSGSATTSTGTLGVESPEWEELDERSLLGVVEDEVPEVNAGTVLIGFRNDGNGCYANAVLQLLAAAGVPAAYGFARETWSDAQLAVEAERLILARASQAADGTYGTRDGGTYVTHRNILLRTLLRQRAAGWLTAFQQQDAMEALTKVLESFERTFNLGGPAQLLQLVGDGTFDDRKPSRFHFLLSVRTYYDLDGIEAAADGGVITWFNLDEEWSVTRLQIHNHVALALRGNDPTTLADIWNADWERAFVGGDRTTDNCRQGDGFYRNAPRDSETTAFFAGNGPDHLIIQIKRFTYNGADSAKNSTVVTVPPALVRAGRNYQLRAFIYHQGATMRQGHYIAYVRIADHWYEANDAVITVDPANLEARRNTSYVYYFVAV